VPFSPGKDEKGQITVPLTGNRTARQEWVNQTIQGLLRYNLDGVNFDFEGPLAQNDPKVGWYTALVNETSIAVHQAIVGGQVSVDVGWSPNNVDGRNYDILGLAAAADFLYVMCYDVQSQVVGRCLADANSPLGAASLGLQVSRFQAHFYVDMSYLYVIYHRFYVYRLYSLLIHAICCVCLEPNHQQYISMGVPPAKLILGVPWYGFDYPCHDADAVSVRLLDIDPQQLLQSPYCTLSPAPFRGAPCSDASGSEKAYLQITQLLEGRSPSSTKGGVGELWFDNSTMSPFFNYISAVDGKRHQLWFDNPASTMAKLRVAADLGIAGYGPYEVSDLNYTTTGGKLRNETTEMWQTLGKFERMRQAGKNLTD
jgi:di-N-acetylchitobiase